MWKPYLKVIAAQAGQALHVLDRFHITSHLNQAVDQVRRAESTRLGAKSKKATQRLKHMRWPLLRRGSRVRGRARQKLNDLLASKLATARAWDLKETFSHFWKYKSVTWAGGFLDYWCFRAMRSRLEPMKKVARMLRAHEPLILNWFRAKGETSNGAVEVVVHGFRKGLAAIVLGETRNPHLTRALVVWLAGLIGIVIIHVVTTVCSHRRPRFVQKATQAITDPLRALLFGHQLSAQHYAHADISPYLWVNGRAPKEETYLAMARDHFANYILEVGGLVEKPLRLTLADLRAMPKQTQITKHCCIQGWSGVAEWGGVSLRHIVGLCRPLPGARYIVFHAFDNKSTSEPHAQGPGYFYGTIRLARADDPQTILAYEMNNHSLPIDHGAPLRLRVETQLGFTMVKYIRAIEFVETYAHIGKGQGGWREDYQYFSQEAGI